jgi:hypothetical protein
LESSGARFSTTWTRRCWQSAENETNAANALQLDTYAADVATFMTSLVVHAQASFAEDSAWRARKILTRVI